jgi:hypothetical protein
VHVLKFFAHFHFDASGLLFCDVFDGSKLGLLASHLSISYVCRDRDDIDLRLFLSVHFFSSCVGASSSSCLSTSHERMHRVDVVERVRRHPRPIR